MPSNLEQQAADFSAQQAAQFANPYTTNSNTFMPGYSSVGQQAVATDYPGSNQNSAWRTLDTVQNSIDQINAQYASNMAQRQQELANMQLDNVKEVTNRNPQGTVNSQQYASHIPYGSTGAGNKVDYSTLAQSRQDVLKNAQSYLGSPYVLGGTTKQGIDCSGLVMNVYNKAGFDVTQHNATWQGQNIPGVRTTIDNLSPGDLVAWRDGSHIAIYAGNGQIIEAANPRVGTTRRAIWADPSQIFGIALRLPGDRIAARRAEANALRTPIVADRLTKPVAKPVAKPSTATKANKKTMV